MKANVKQLAKEQWQKHLDTLEEKNVRILVCPKCNEMYKGKFLHSLVVCNNCGWRRDESKTKETS